MSLSAFKKGRQAFFMIVLVCIVGIYVHVDYFHGEYGFAKTQNRQISVRSKPSERVQFHDLNSKRSRAGKRIFKHSLKHRLVSPNDSNKTTVVSTRKKKLKAVEDKKAQSSDLTLTKLTVKKKNATSPKITNKNGSRREISLMSRKVNTSLLAMNIFNQERLNQQIQEAREAIQIQLKSMKKTSNLVLLVTYMRSGSSWLGEMIRQSKDTLYIFEPFQFLIEQGYYTNGLVCFNNDKCRQPLSDAESHHIIVKNLLQIYNCDLGNLHPMVIKNVIRKQRNLCQEDQASRDESEINTSKIKNHQLKRSDGNKPNINITEKSEIPKKILSIHRCIKLLTDVCRRSRYKVIKTIRFSMDLVHTLMDFIPGLKVIHLVRDPRAITNSRARSGNMRMAREQTSHSSALCKEMYLDLQVGDILRQKYPRRITLVVYEALAERSTQGAKYVYKFLDIKFDRHVETWVYNSTHADKNNGFYGTSRSNTSNASAHWRKDLNFTQVYSIQRYCGKVFKLLGYIAFKTSTDLKDLSLPSRKYTTLRGFT